MSKSSLSTNSIYKTLYFHLRNIAKVRKILSPSRLKKIKIIHAFITLQLLQCSPIQMCVCVCVCVCVCSPLFFLSPFFAGWQKSLEKKGMESSECFFSLTVLRVCVCVCVCASACAW